MANSVGPRVALSCADERHALSAAIALHRLGVLADYFTSIGAASQLAKIPHLPRAFRGDAIARVTQALGELPERPVDRALFAGAKALSRCKKVPERVTEGAFSFHEVHFDAAVARLVSSLSNVDVFHGYGRYCHRSLEAASLRGMRTVLDAFELHPRIAHELQLEEEEAFGIVRNVGEPGDSEVARSRNRVREYESADIVVACLNTVKASLISGGIEAAKIVTLPLVANAYLREPVVNRRQKPRGSFQFLYVGGLSWTKGLPRLLEAWKMAALSNAELTVVGRGSGPWARRLQSMIEVTPHCHLIEGVSKHELVELYGISDLLIFPSLVGGIGLVVFEAIEQHLPVMTSNGEGVLTPGVECLQVEPRDVADFATALSRAPQVDLTAMAETASEKLRNQTWSNYGRRLVSEVYIPS